MKNIGLCLIIVLLNLPILLVGQYTDLNIQQGEEYYANGKYDSAVISFQNVLDQGFHSSELYYNLGNAYYKQSNMPSAILFYEKALKIDPSNEDILFNLKLANSRIQDKIEALPLLFFIRWYIGAYNMFSVDNWAKIVLILFAFSALFSLFFFLGRRILIRKAGFYLGLIFLLLSAAGLFLTVKKDTSQKENSEAIVFNPSVTVKSSPNENGVDLFVIHEGTKVQVVDRVGKWCEIKIANGSMGWIEVVAIQHI